MKRSISVIALMHAFAFVSCAQVAVSLSPVARMQFLDTSGEPLAGGFVYTYAPGTDAKQASYTHSTGTAQNTNPIVLDSGGSANVWLDNLLSYKFVVQNSSGVQQWTIIDNIATPLAMVLTGNVTFAGTDTVAGNVAFSETLNASSINGIPDVTLRSGADLGAQLNAAYTAAPATGLVVTIAPGKHSFATPAVFSIPNKPIYIRCGQGSDGIAPTDSGSTTLNYTGKTGIAITFQTAGGGGIDGCTITGNGVSAGTTGVLVTGAMLVLNNYDIHGFGTNLQYGDGTHLTQFISSTNFNVHDPVTKNFYEPNSVAQIEGAWFSHGSFNQKRSSFSPTCTDIEGGMQAQFSRVHFDQCGITINPTYNSRPAVADIDFTSDHWENPNGPTDFAWITLGANATNTSSINLFGGEMDEDFPSSRTSQISLAGSARLTIHGTSMLPNETVAQCVLSLSAASYIEIEGAGITGCIAPIGGIYGTAYTQLADVTPGVQILGSGRANLFVGHSITAGELSGVTNRCVFATTAGLLQPSLHECGFYKRVGANGILYAIEPTLNLISGTGASVSCADNTHSSRTDCTISLAVFAASLNTSSATRDNVSIKGMTASGHCSLAPTNSIAASNIATTYISAKTVDQITVTHAGTSGMTYDIVCTSK